MNELKIIQAQQRHRLSIFQLMQACAAHLQARQIKQWYEGYPDLPRVDMDIQAGHTYSLFQKENLLGAITLNETQDPQYQNINWNIQGKILVIHRLAVHPKHQGRGYAQRLMQFAENFGKKHHYQAIRLDAYSGNKRTQQFYQKQAYQAVGEIKFPYQPLPCICYEKKLDQPL